MESIMIADAVAEGLVNDGGLSDAYDGGEDQSVNEKHSRAQAGCIIGFFNVWQITGDERYLQKSLNSWDLVKEHICYQAKGERFWGVTENYSLMMQDKVGILNVVSTTAQQQDPY